MALLGKVLVAGAGEDGEGAREGDYQADSGRLPEACPCLMEAVQVGFGVYNVSALQWALLQLPP